jgi:probable DNA repair protein
MLYDSPMTNSSSDYSTQLAGLSTQILDHESLFERLCNGHTLVTGNSRLSRVLSSQYSQWRIAMGDKQWQSPEIFSWNIWLDKIWETAALRGVDGTDRAVPGNRQLLSLWEYILNNELLAHQLLRPASLATQLRDTRRLMVEWQLDFNHPAWFDGDNENYTAFHQWNKAFEKHCEKGRWISPEDRTGLLTKAIKDSLVLPAGNIDLLGFDEFNPNQAALLSALAGNGNPVCLLSITSRQKDAVLLKCRDSSDELEQAVRRVRYWYENDPGSRIAIVVPDLQKRRPEVERQLDEILTPGNIQTTRLANPWNISMGTPLASVPMIETAFDLFKLFDKRIDIQHIGRVLRSPWLRGASFEHNSRALLEKCLRDKYPRQLKLAEVRYRASEIKKHDRQHSELPKDQHKPRAWNSPALSIVLDTLIHFEQQTRGARPASAWAESFDKLLASVGWPFADETESETATLDHGENWQTLQTWREALRELASLDAVVARFGRETAINHLKHICREKIFQFRTPQASIQVLGLYEVNGLHFDHLWVVGMHAGTWPSTARPNPFIPAKLQMSGQTPHSSPQRELAVAQTVTQRLLETAPDCVFSYPAKLEGEEVLPSPLLNAKPINEVSELPGWNGYTWRRVVASADKPFDQPLAMPGKLVHGTTKGGSNILENQAVCPFRAFASNRLGAEGLETPTDGISPMLHGSLVHGVLEYFWKETKTQAALLQLDDTDLEKRVRKHVENVTGENRGLKQRPSFRSVEADRIQRHVLAYLKLEMERGPFEAVGFEEEVHTEIEGQTIRLYIDRVDRLPNGDEVIIDYKTGTKQPKKWFGNRPEDPQLPLYAISAKKTPAAVVFGIIREYGCEYKGVVTHAGLFPGLPPKENNSTRELVEAGNRMPETINNWRQILHRLMSDFLAGEAAIDPKNGRNTCTNSYCELQSLCRIGELENIQKTRHEVPA